MYPNAVDKELYSMVVLNQLINANGTSLKAEVKLNLKNHRGIPKVIFKLLAFSKS
jgi:hypothetical protein